jgi:hypothetical protein
MSSVATYPVNIHRYDGETTISTTPFQLTQWKHALNLEVKTGMSMSGGRKVSTYLRKRLGAPRSYTNEMLRDYIETCLNDINQQMGVQ